MGERALVAALLLAVALVVVRVALFPWAASDPVHSRWLTIEALLEDRTFVVGHRVEGAGGTRDVGRIVGLPTVDLMLDPEEGAFYSSKPPFLQVAVAPLVRVIALALGSEDLRRDAVPIMRVLLLGVNALPLAVFLLWLARVARRREGTRVALLLLAVAGLATFLTAFANVLSNHLSAALGAACALGGVVLVVEGGRRARLFLLAGLGAGLAAALEYPALTLVVATVWLLARVDPRRALLVTLPAAALPLALAHAADLAAFGDPLFFLRRKAEWFQYAGSYWRSPPGLDGGEPSGLVYAFHFLVGHHGVAWLTPLFLVALVVSARVLARGASPPRAWLHAMLPFALVAVPIVETRVFDGWHEIFLALLAAPLLAALLVPGRDPLDVDGAVARLTLACALPTLAFYLGFTNNYGGVTAGPRWLLWLTPLWLFALVPWLRVVVTRRLHAALFALCLLLSAWSAHSPGANPYRHPWTYAGP